MRTLCTLCLLLAMFGDAAAKPNVAAEPNGLSWAELRQQRATDPALWRVRAFLRRNSLPMLERNLPTDVVAPLRPPTEWSFGRVIIQEEEEILGLGDLE